MLVFLPRPSGPFLVSPRWKQSYARFRSISDSFTACTIFVCLTLSFLWAVLCPKRLQSTVRDTLGELSGNQELLKIMPSIFRHVWCCVVCVARRLGTGSWLFDKGGRPRSGLTGAFIFWGPLWAIGMVGRKLDIVVWAKRGTRRLWSSQRCDCFTSADTS